MEGKTEVVRGASLTSVFDVGEITQIGRFRFTQEIVGNGNNFELYALFDIEPVK